MKTQLWVFIAGLLSGLAPLAAASLQQNYLGIYLEINSAQQLEKADDYMGALVCYGVAETFLAKIHHYHPDWETALVARRLKDCQDKVAALTPLAAKQLASLNNEWSLSTDPLHHQGDWSALERAQAKVTFPQVMLANHPELAKAGLADQIRPAQKAVDDLESAELSQSAPAKNAQTAQ